MAAKGSGLRVVDGGGGKEQRRPAGLAILGQPEPTPERADAARNRQRILDAARKLMGRRDIKDICMDEVARAAGVGKGTLYRRFVDRSSLCMALLDDNERVLQERVLRRFDLPQGTKPITRLTTLLGALFDFTVENAAILSEALASQRSSRFDAPPWVWRRTELVRLMQQAIHAGELPAQDVEIAADLILAAMEPDLIRAQLARGADENALRQGFLKFWLRAVGAA